VLKKMLFAALLGGLVTLGADAQAAPDAVFILTIEGKLVYTDGSGPRIPEFEPWIGPGLETGGTWFGLDFGKNKKLFERAEKLYGQRVLVTGRLEKRQLGGLIPHTINVLVVADLHSLPADGGILKKTVQVEMKGQFLFRADHLDILLPDSRLTVNGQTYVVNLGNNHDLWNVATAVDGHTAIVTGTLDGNTLNAVSIKPAGDYIRKTISVEVKGKLIWHPGIRCLSPRFTVTGGKDHFGLEFASPDLEKLAVALSGSNVIVTGALVEDTERGDIITVTGLKAA
jgi:hypothetical protein